MKGLQLEHNCLIVLLENSYCAIEIYNIIFFFIIFQGSFRELMICMKNTVIIYFNAVMGLITNWASSLSTCDVFFNTQLRQISR